jgi:hypothetical protein
MQDPGDIANWIQTILAAGNPQYACQRPPTDSFTGQPLTLRLGAIARCTVLERHEGTGPGREAPWRQCGRIGWIDTDTGFLCEDHWLLCYGCQDCGVALPEAPGSSRLCAACQTAWEVAQAAPADVLPFQPPPLSDELRAWLEGEDEEDTP